MPGAVVPARGGRPASVAGEASAGVAWSVPAGGHRRWGGRWRVEAGVGRGERRRARASCRCWREAARERRGVPVGGIVGGEARAGVVECLRGSAIGGEAGGACRPAWGPRREAVRVGRRLGGSFGDGHGVGGSSGDGCGVGGSSDEEGGVGVAGIHDLVTGSRIGGGWRRRGSLMTMKSKTRSERRKRRELAYIGEGPLVLAPTTGRD
ncbi:uncharacterized protein [Miscanthus floridulus]|uniref:uncharacterized protein n=1 Tax=Miscanthus floridulus TaxID=154761 RepID=UPI003458B9EB